MSTPNLDIAAHAASIADRLRLVQGECADIPTDARQRRLAEELQRGVQGLAPELRDAVLVELIARSSSWGTEIDSASTPSTHSARSASAGALPGASERTDSRMLVAQLEASVSQMSPADRIAIAEGLKRAGFATPGPGVLPAAQSKSVLATLGLSDSSSSIDQERLLELTEMMLQFMLVVDQLVWRIWRDVAPTSSVKRPAAFKADLGKFLCGDQNVARSQVRDDVERLRKVVAGLTSAAPRAGELFATRHVEQLAPAAVESVTSRGPLPMLGTAKETACWRKYQELARGLDSESLTRDLLAMWGEAAERIITGGKG